MTVATDWRGTPLTVGSTIVYPSRHSSSVWMTEAVVEAIHYQAHDRSKIAKLIVRRSKMTRRWLTEIVKPVVTLFNVMDVTVLAPPLRSQSQVDWNTVRAGVRG